MDLNLKKDYAEVFSSEAGKRVLDDMCSRFGLAATSFVVGDPYQTAYREGMRYVVLSIIATLNRPVNDLVENKYKSLRKKDSNV